PSDAVVLVCDPERVRARAHDLVATSQEFLQASWAAAAGGGQAPIDLGAAAYRTLGDIRTHALSRGMSWWSLSPFGLDPDAAASPPGAPLRTETGELVSVDVDVTTGVDSVPLDYRAAPAYRGETETALADIESLVRDGHRVVLVTEGHGP